MIKVRFSARVLAAALAACMVAGCSGMSQDGGKEAYSAWKNGPPADANFFPIAVWLQEPADAVAYKAAGVNMYVGLWNGPSEKQLADLSAAGMPVICEMNAVGLQHVKDPIIVGWMHGDEPDNAQSSPGKDAQGNPLPKAPIPPKDVIAEYQKYRRIDPTRPIMLNLGQGVANDDWKGRGKDNGNFEPYKAYVKSGDIISFDVYPVSGNGIRNRGDLALEGRGLDRLKAWTGNKKIIWNCIECTAIDGDRRMITPAEMRSAVWISLVHGSTGLIYFCHQFGTGKSPRHLLIDPTMLAAVTAVNKEVKELAPVLNSPTLEGAVTVEARNDAPVDVMAKRYDAGKILLIAVGMSKSDGKAAFHVTGMTGAGTAEVVGEGRTLAIKDGKFEDDFAGFAVHRYLMKVDAMQAAGR